MGTTTDLMTPREVAALRGVGYRTVLRALGDGTLPAQRLGDSFAVARADAEAWEPRPRGWPAGRARKGKRTARKEAA